jgi:hypothetical protein
MYVKDPIYVNESKEESYLEMGTVKFSPLKFQRDFLDSKKQYFIVQIFPKSGCVL